MGLREDKKREQRQKIFDRAIELFRERGFEETRVRDIVAPLRISEATFFNYFPTKLAILEAYANDVAKLFVGFVDDEARNEAVPVADRLRRLIRILGGGFTTDPDLMYLLMAKTPFFFGVDAEQRSQDKRMMINLGELFRQGQLAGEIRTDVDPAQLGELFVASFVLTIANSLGGWWETESLESRLDRALSVFLDGCRPRTA